MICNKCSNPVTIDGHFEMQSSLVQQYPTRYRRCTSFPHCTASVGAYSQPMFRTPDWKIRLFNYPDDALHTLHYLCWNPKIPVEALYLGAEGKCIISRWISHVLQPRFRLMSTATALRQNDGSGIVAEYQATARSSKLLTARVSTYGEPISIPEINQPFSRMLIYDLSCQSYNEPYRGSRPVVESFTSLDPMNAKRYYSDLPLNITVRTAKRIIELASDHTY